MAINIKEYVINIARRFAGFLLSFIGKGMQKYPKWTGVEYAKDIYGEHIIMDAPLWWNTYGAKNLNLGGAQDGMGLLSIYEDGRGWNAVGAMFDPKTNTVYTVNDDPFDLVEALDVQEMYASLFCPEPLAQLQRLFPSKNVKADALLPLTPNQVPADKYEEAWQNLLNQGRDMQLHEAKDLFEVYTGFKVE